MKIMQHLSAFILRAGIHPTFTQLPFPVPVTRASAGHVGEAMIKTGLTVYPAHVFFFLSPGALARALKYRWIRSMRQKWDRKQGNLSQTTAVSGESSLQRPLKKQKHNQASRRNLFSSLFYWPNDITITRLTWRSFTWMALSLVRVWRREGAVKVKADLHSHEWCREIIIHKMTSHPDSSDFMCLCERHSGNRWKVALQSPATCLKSPWSLRSLTAAISSVAVRRWCIYNNPTKARRTVVVPLNHLVLAVQQGVLKS